MKLSRDNAIKGGIIRSVNDIKLTHEQRKIVKKGIVYDSFERYDTDAFGVLVTARVDIQKVAEREIEGNYVYSPIERNFLKYVNILALLLKFKRKFCQKYARNKSRCYPFYCVQ